jgi:hypothetical protein
LIFQQIERITVTFKDHKSLGNDAEKKAKEVANGSKADQWALEANLRVACSVFKGLTLS